MPSLFDVILAALVGVLWPLHQNLIEWPRFQHSLRTGQPGARVRGYWKTIVHQWVLSALVLTAWLVQGRDLPVLGLGWGEGWLAWLMAGLAVTGAALMALQTRSIASSAEARAQVRRSVAGVREVLPHDRGEFAVFRALSVTAGVCEELLFRGYLTWVIAGFAGPGVAVLGSAALFGLGHLYQGVRGVLQSGTIGLVMSGICIAAGSLWAAMVLHAAVDWGSGEAGLLAIEGEARGEGVAVAEVGAGA